MMSRIRKLEKLLPLVYFLFVFCLYFSLLSEAYFTDEQDVFYGGYNIAKGQDLYCSYLTQHMPFSYYMASLIALFGARTIFQYRIGIYLMLSLVWELAWLRHRRKIHPAALWLMPLLYLAMLKTIPLGTSMISDHWQGIGLILILLELVRYAEERTVSTPCAAMVSLGILLSFGTVFIAAYSLLCLFLAMLALQGKHMRERRKTLPDPDFRAELLPREENGVTEARLAMPDGGDSGAAADRIFRLLAGAGLPVRMMKPEKETLEEVFLRETDRTNE